jgi:hypothetical protein
MKKLLLIVLLLLAITMQSQTKIMSALYESFDSGSWQNYGGYNYEYDSNNNVTSETYYYYYDNVWTASDKSTYTYNANNKLVSETYLSWATNQFENNYKTIYTYNASNKPTTISNQDWNGGIWVNTSKTDITYNDSFFVNAISKIWDGSQYVDDYKSTPTYTGNNATQWLNKQWNGTQWTIDNRTLLTYNADNKITNYKTQAWNGTAWEEEENITYTLSANFNRLLQLSSLFGDLEGKHEYTYDTNALMSSFGNPFKDKTGIDYVFEDFPYTNKILSELYSYYDSTTSAYILSSRTTYNYNNSLPLARADFKLNNISLYPNPANTTIAVSGLTSSEKISIYNVLGTKVYEGSVMENENINIENLSSGLYVVNFENGFALKFIKK